MRKSIRAVETRWRIWTKTARSRIKRKRKETTILVKDWEWNEKIKCIIIKKLKLIYGLTKVNCIIEVIMNWENKVKVEWNRGSVTWEVS